MWLLVVRALFTGIIVVLVSETAGRLPRIGGLLLSLPVVSILAFTMTWMTTQKPEVVSSLAYEMLILIPLTLVFYVPFLFIEQWNLSFWIALALGIVLTCLAVGLCFWMRSS